MIDLEAVVRELHLKGKPIASMTRHAWDRWRVAGGKVRIDHDMAIARAVHRATLVAERDRHWDEYQNSTDDKQLAMFHNCELHRLDAAIEALDREGGDE